MQFYVHRYEEIPGIKKVPLMNNLHAASLTALSALTYLHANKVEKKKWHTGEAVHIIIKKEKEKHYVSGSSKPPTSPPTPSTFTFSTRFIPLS